MAKIVAYECKHCKTLHRNVEDYQKCLNKCLRDDKKAKEKSIERKNKITDYHSCRLKATSIQHFIDLVFEMYNKYHKVKLVEMYIERGLHWNIQVSNTHTRPINGVENWGGKDDKPKGYPGWTCNIHFTFEKDESGFQSEKIKAFPGFNPSGGGSANSSGKKGYHLQYSCYFYLEDFPLIENDIKGLCQDYWPIRKRIDEQDEACRNLGSEYIHADETYKEISDKIAELVRQKEAIEKKISQTNSEQSMRAKFLRDRAFDDVSYMYPLEARGVLNKVQGSLSSDYGISSNNIPKFTIYPRLEGVSE